MVYTNEVRKKLDTILKAFEKYIDQQSYFDIVYSKKIGYAWIVIDPQGGADIKRLDTPEKMLDVLFNEVINDVTAESANQHTVPNTPPLSQTQKDEVRRRITDLLEPLTEDKDRYLQFMERYLNAYQENNGFIGEPDKI